MTIPLAKTYVDKLFAERNFGDIYWAISVIEPHWDLPEEFWLFARIYEWAPNRGGWQYYEGLSPEKFTRISEGMVRFGLSELAEKYRRGYETWDGPTRATEIFGWLDDHADEIHNEIFELIAPKKDCLAEG